MRLLQLPGKLPSNLLLDTLKFCTCNNTLLLQYRTARVSCIAFTCADLKHTSKGRVLACGMLLQAFGRVPVIMFQLTSRICNCKTATQLNVCKLYCPKSVMLSCCWRSSAGVHAVCRSDLLTFQSVVDQYCKTQGLSVEVNRMHATQQIDIWD